MISLALALLGLCAPLWSPHAAPPQNRPDLTCYADRNGTTWCAHDRELLMGVDSDDSY